ncbi:hypothetical protein FRC00_003116 [Tulasnella sp. 408]|nr:hypothetical protein FRC00_003116 [Tulasnella sp. 408]
MPTLQDVEDAIGALEAYVAAQIPVITRGIQRLTDDLRRYGPPELPPLPEMPSIPLFASIPPPPPPAPSPPPQNLNDKVGGWVARHRRGLVGAGVVMGVGLAAGGWLYWSSKRIASAAAKAHARTKGAKEVVVLLGADSPLGHLVIQDLRANDYIVIASVSAPESVSEVERLGKGYVKALVLDPTDCALSLPLAGTYSAASYLPLWILDPLILLPQRLITYRDWMKQKTRSLREDVARERRRRKEREREKEAQRELEENEGKQMVVVPKPNSRARTASQSSAASATGSGNGDAASASPASVPSEVPDNASEPDSENGVPSAPASEPGGHHMGESWVMDVDAEGHASQTQP